MTLSQEVDLLRKIPLFAKIDPAQLKLLAFASEMVLFSAGQELFRQGDIGNAAYIIMSGEVDILIEGPKGEEIAVARFGKDKLIGEIAILIDVPRTATARAVTELTTLEISKDLFFQLLKEFPQISIEIMRELAHRLERTTSRLREASNQA